MSSGNGLDIATELEILRLADEGLSSRQISKRTGVPRSTVVRRIDAYQQAQADDDDVDDDAPLSWLAPQARAPFTFVGMQPTELDIPGVDAVAPVLEERFLDADGNSVSIADIYRADQDGGSDRGYVDDVLAQIAAAWYVRVDNSDGGTGWHWEAVAEASP